MSERASAGVRSLAVESESAKTIESVKPFLDALFASFFGSGHAGYIEIRLVRSRDQMIQQLFFPNIKAVVDSSPQLAQANGDRDQFDVYVGVNPRSRQSGKEEDIEYVIALHADVDWKQQQSDTAAPKPFKLAPSINVFSGHGNHPYFMLKEPVRVADDRVRALLRGYNSALATALGADRCHDLSRVLRLPGFRNWKDSRAPAIVQLQTCDPDRRYSLSDFDFLSPEPVAPSSSRLEQAKTDREAPELSGRLQSLVQTHSILKLRWAGDPFGLNDTSKSGIDMSIASILNHAGCSAKEIAAAIRLAPYNNNRQRELTEQYLARTIERAGADSSSGSVKPSQATIPIPLAVAKSRINKWLAFSPGEDLAIDAALATKIANDAAGDPVFVVLVGPSSGAKSEIIRALKDVPGVYSLGSLTARTLASGLDPKKASLLARLSEDVHTLAIKDMGTILSMSPNERGDLLQQLRDIFDGMFRREWGSGKGPLEWSGRLGLLGGATPAIEREFSTLSALGERFLFFRMTVANRTAQAKRAIEACGREGEMREEIHEALASVLGGISADKVNAVQVTREIAEIIEAIACALTQARTPVVRDRYDKTVEYLPQLEGPARAAKALKKLGQALAVLYGHDSVGTAELFVLARIGGDSIPSVRARSLLWLYRQHADTWQTAKVVGQAIQLPTSTVTRLLEDLATLQIVDRVAKKSSEASPFEVRLKPAFRSVFEKGGLALAMEGAYPCESAEEDELSQGASSANSQGYSQVLVASGNTGDSNTTWTGGGDCAPPGVGPKISIAFRR